MSAAPEDKRTALQMIEGASGEMDYQIIEKKVDGKVSKRIAIRVFTIAHHLREIKLVFDAFDGHDLFLQDPGNIDWPYYNFQWLSRSRKGLAAYE
jgi:hypothetical protein